MKKLLVWDCDDTLWDGTLIEGDVSLPEGRYELCKELHDRGVVQSTASHNLLSDVQQKLHEFDLYNFFLLPQAAFGVQKSWMVQTIVEELGLSKLSDVVFVDDLEFNRTEVQTMLPDVITCAPGMLDRVVKSHFTKDEYTDVDRSRVAMYRAEQARKESGKAYGGDKLTFLRDCDMWMIIGYPAPSDMQRVQDLVKRANRLAAAAYAFSDAELEQASAADELIVMWAGDRFGDYGLSGVMVMREDAPVIELLVISCRMQGKGYGSAMLGTVINQHVGEGIQAMWQETEYNAGVRSLYEWYKFIEVKSGVDNVVSVIKDIGKPVDLPDWIKVEVRL